MNRKLTTHSVERLATFLAGRDGYVPSSEYPPLEYEQPSPVGRIVAAVVVAVALAAAGIAAGYKAVVIAHTDCNQQVEVCE
jgi:hypothetical protein